MSKLVKERSLLLRARRKVQELKQPAEGNLRAAIRVKRATNVIRGQTQLTHVDVSIVAAERRSVIGEEPTLITRCQYAQLFEALDHPGVGDAELRRQSEHGSRVDGGVQPQTRSDAGFGHQEVHREGVGTTFF